MKIGVLSDTHIPERAKDVPAKVLEAFEGVDMIIHAGDFVDIRVAEALRKVCPNLKGVSGNMDSAQIRTQFPEKEIIAIGTYTIGVRHGFGPPNRLLDLMQDAFKKDLVDIVIFGHSHNPLNQKVKGTLFFNPGSPTDEMFAPYKSFGIIEINDTIEARIVKI